jgi:hypothetical protein
MDVDNMNSSMGVEDRSEHSNDGSWNPAAGSGWGHFRYKDDSSAVNMGKTTEISRDHKNKDEAFHPDILDDDDNDKKCIAVGMYNNLGDTVFTADVIKLTYLV